MTAPVRLSSRSWAAGFGSRGRLSLLILAVVGGAACSTENGIGTLRGVLNVPACTFKEGEPQPLEDTNPYERTWRHFVGEPFDSLTERFPANQLNIRMQDSSARWEAANALTFWVLDSYEAARCMLGGVTKDGTDNWDPLLCDRSPGSLGPNGEGRLLIGTEGESVGSHFLLFDACPGAMISSDALGACGGGSCPDVTLCPGRGSWIAFSKFGAPPADVGPSFKVNLGQQIEASAFHVELCDATTVRAQQALRVPVPAPAITGTLDGEFSFTLEP